MRIDEIIISPLDEDVGETADINRVARYIENFILKVKDKINPTIMYSLAEMGQLSGGAPPDIKSKTLRAIFLEPSSDRQVLEFGFNHPRIAKQQAFGEFMASAERPKILINIDQLLAHKKSMASTIAHEIQHALDFYKSKGAALSKATAPAADGAVDFDAYLKQSDEINARFAQALMAIAEAHASIEKSQAPSIITQSLAAHKLTKAIVGDRGYKRLMSRAYKFVDGMNLLATQRKKPGFRDKIKGPIKRLIS